VKERATIFDTRVLAQRILEQIQNAAILSRKRSAELGPNFRYDSRMFKAFWVGIALYKKAQGIIVRHLFLSPDGWSAQILLARLLLNSRNRIHRLGAACEEVRFL
jgi:hypothetical protein